MDENYQHMYKIISDAIMYDDTTSSNFEKVNEFMLKDNIKVYVYEQVGDYTNKMKEYFFNKMLEYYPDKADYFSYILQ